MSELRNPLQIKKEKVQVTIFTEHHRIDGEVHVQPSGRLSDFFNLSDKPFIPLTNATVYKISDGTVVSKVEFLTINKNSISLAFPTTTPQ